MADQANDAFKNPDPDESVVEVKAAPQQLDIFVDKLMAITDENGRPKYDSIEKALDALSASQAHIKQLEAEQTQLRDEVAKAQTLEEVVKRLGGKVDDNAEKPKVETPPSGGLSEEQAAELVRKILNGEKQKDSAITNLKSVNDTLVQRFGDKASEVVMQKAKELGTTAQQLKELSASNPNMVLALFGGSTSSPSATSSSFNLSGYKPKQEELKRPEQSLISGPGATDKKRMDFMAQIRANVYKKYGVETP